MDRVEILNFHVFQLVLYKAKFYAKMKINK